MSRQDIDIYGGQDPLDLAAYSFPEIAHCLQVPVATVRAWSLGRHYPAKSGKRFFQPLIEIANRDAPALSFRNVVELHVLSAIRRRHEVEMPAVRKALGYLSEHVRITHPLASQAMLTDGKDIFIESYGKLVNISQRGQLEMKEIVAVYLARIDRDRAGSPLRLYPFTRSRIEDAPKLIVMNPRIQFGRPCIAATGIPTSVIADRYKAGDAIAELAKDYGQDPCKIEEAIRYEFQSTAA